MHCRPPTIQVYPKGDNQTLMSTKGDPPSYSEEPLICSRDATHRPQMLSSLRQTLNGTLRPLVRRKLNSKDSKKHLFWAFQWTHTHKPYIHTKTNRQKSRHKCTLPTPLEFFSLLLPPLLYFAYCERVFKGSFHYSLQKNLRSSTAHRIRLL